MIRNKILPLLILWFSLCGSAFSEVPYDSYLYNRWQETMEVPHSYVPDGVFFGEQLGTAALKNPQGLFVQPVTGDVFIADSGNNRIVRLDRNLKFIQSYEGFANPQDVFVSENNEIFVADTANSRIVKMDLQGNILIVIGKPKSDLIPEGFVYSPTKLVVDGANRIYVVAQGVNKGLMELTQDGYFGGFFGAAKVNVKMGEYIWKVFSTDEQRARMERFVPTVYNNLSIDDEGFLFVTTSALKQYEILNAINFGAMGVNVKPVRRLNPKEDDILKAKDFYPPVGDISFMSMESSISGPSAFIDIAISQSGMYHVLDQKRGRVFTYDPDGILISIFGGLGSREGLLSNPSALELGKDGSILVLDSGRSCLNRYKVTDYGKEVIKGIEGYYGGNYQQSRIGWENALKLNANLEWAYKGIGNALYREDNYKGAMDYYEVIREDEYFSRAFKYHRKEVLEKFFGWIVGGFVLIFVAFRIVKKILSKKGGAQ